MAAAFVLAIGLAISAAAAVAAVQLVIGQPLNAVLLIMVAITAFIIGLIVAWPLGR